MHLFLVIFAVGSTVGPWAAWRRSPLYSTAITAKVAAVFLLIVAAIAGVAMAISAPLSLSPAVQGTLLAAVIVAIGTGATGLIIHTTDSHVAQLPSSVRVLTVERHKVQRWIWRTAVFVLICAASAVAFPSWSWLPGVLGTLVLLGCGPTLMGFYMRARRLDRGMSQVMAEPWAHWQYTPQQWEAWATSERASAMVTANTPDDRSKQLKAILLMVGSFALGSLFIDGSMREKIAITGGLSAVMVVLTLSVGSISRSAAERAYRRLCAAPPEVYFGEEGLFCNGAFTPWILSGSYLTNAATLHDSPPRLVLTFSGGPVPVTLRVPVPAAAGADVTILQQKLTRKCPKAVIRLV